MKDFMLFENSGILTIRTEIFNVATRTINIGKNPDLTQINIQGDILQKFGKCSLAQLEGDIGMIIDTITDETRYNDKNFGLTILVITT